MAKQDNHRFAYFCLLLYLSAKIHNYLETPCMFFDKKSKSESHIFCTTNSDEPSSNELYASKWI